MKKFSTKTHGIKMVVFLVAFFVLTFNANDVKAVPPYEYPIPTITSFGLGQDGGATVGDSPFNLLVYGTGFTQDSIIRVNGLNRNTSVVNMPGGSVDYLRIAISSADLAVAGTLSITVFNPSPGGGTSNIRTFAIENPAPDITSISPVSAVVGSPAITLTVNGTGFTSSSRVDWEFTTPLQTTYVSPIRLTALIPASLLQGAGLNDIRVFNPSPGGGSSDLVEFRVNATQLVIIKHSIGGDGTFNFSIAPSANAQPADVEFENIITNGFLFDSSFFGTITLPEIPGTTYSVRESVPAGWTLTSKSCSVNLTGVTTATGVPDNSGVNNVVISSGKTTTCTFTNTKNNTPILTVRKAIVPADDPGRFNLFIGSNQMATNVGEGCTTGNEAGCTTGPAILTGPGTYAVHETAVEETNLSNYTVTFSCVGPPAPVYRNVPPFSVTMPASEHITCTLTNTRIMPMPAHPAWQLRFEPTTLGGVVMLASLYSASHGMMVLWWLILNIIAGFIIFLIIDRMFPEKK